MSEEQTKVVAPQKSEPGQGPARPAAARIELKPSESGQRVADAVQSAGYARVDPEERHTDTELASGTSLRNKDPERRYTLVYLNGHLTSQYRNAGYVVEKYREHDPGTGNFGVRLLMDDGPLDADGPRSIGQNIEFQGHVLMSVSRARHEHLYQNGSPFTGTGQRRFDELEAQIKSPTFDPVLLPHMRVKNETKDIVKR